MTTSNNVSRELIKMPFTGLENLEINKETQKVLVFKQSEKVVLKQLGYDVSTIHEYQGKQAANIIVIRLSSKDEDIYNSLPHCLVAITRHTKSFIYIGATIEDTLTRWIRYGGQYTDEELKEHYREINSAFLGQERLKKGGNKT